MSDKSEFAGLLIGLFMVFGLGLAVGTDLERKSMQRGAVKHSAAHWSADADGDAKFEWGKP